MTDDIPETGAVFTFGKSHFADNEPSHFFIKSDPVVAISCGDEHSAVICPGNKVSWISGCLHPLLNSRSKLSLGDKITLYKACIRPILTYCGPAFAHNGRVFVFGANSWGQLGLGHKDEMTRPSCVKWLKPQRATFVACGRAHTVFVTDTNAIYTVGCNDEGQLGTGDMEHQTVPQYVELEPTAPIKQVSAGSNHTAILTDEGCVFMCGSNSEGQLGLGEDTRSAVKFTELTFMEKIAFVECGYYHTVFITDQGAVFVTGDNENQKLGLSSTDTIVYVPQVLPIGMPIKSACCGASHTFLLSMDETKILAFGSNEKGQLGMTKDVEYVVEPKEIDMEKMFDGFQLKLVACGAMHTAFVTDNGLLYTCGESRHGKLCLEEIDTTDNSNGVDPNQYTPKRVTAMNGHIVDNVACGGCHTLLTATKGSNADFTNNDFSIVDATTRHMALTELPPLQKIPSTIKTEEHGYTIEDMTNSNIDDRHNIVDNVNGNANEEIGSFDSLEANVSGSHIVNINDLENENGSTHDVLDVNSEIDQSSHIAEVENKVMDVIVNMDTAVDEAQDKIKNTFYTVKETVTDKVEVVEEFVKKCAVVDPVCDGAKTILSLPDKAIEIANSLPPKTPIIEELLQVPDISQISPGLSKHSDEKSENGQSENETIPCGSDKSSPQTGKTAKTQAVIPIVRSEDHVDGQVDKDNNGESDVVVNKMQEKGRFARMFQSLRDKENSCMGKGKVIEEKAVETIHKGIDNAEESVHKMEETVETQIRNQTNSSTCTLL